MRVWWNGIHDRLKIYWGQPHEGSTPSTRTTYAIVVELVYAAGLEPAGGNPMRVRLPPMALLMASISMVDCRSDKAETIVRFYSCQQLWNIAQW